MTNLSPHKTANCVLAIVQSLGGFFQSLLALFKTRYSSFPAALSLGKCPRVRTALRIFELSSSIAFVVYMILRTASGKTKNGVITSQLRRHAAAIAEYFSSHSPVSNASKASKAASAFWALYTVRKAPATDLRSFQEAKFIECRIKWTNQVCTVVSGNTAFIASGKPLSDVPLAL